MKCTRYCVMFFLLCTLFMMATISTANAGPGPGLGLGLGSPSDDIPKPKEWPEKFHALLVMNDTEANIMQVNNLWYDWKKGLNVQLIQYQQGKLLHAISWNNGTSFYYSVEGESKKNDCIVHEFGVGVLRPNWLDGANYLGQVYIDGFFCNLWEKLEFIWYYEEVRTNKPIHWTFYTGLDVYVMTFGEVDEFPEKSQWQAPGFCFDKKLQASDNSDILSLGLPHSIL